MNHSDTITPAEYKTFCESTYAALAHIDREEYLRLLLIEELGDVASLLTGAMRDGVRRTCTACGGHGYVDIPDDDELNTFARGYGLRVTLIRASCIHCDRGGVTSYGAEAVDRDRLKKELGDVMWCAMMLNRDLSLFVTWDEHASEPLKLTAWHNPYIATTSTEFQRACMLCFEFNFNPEEIAIANVEKLKGQ